ncbi:MAG TPA: hypothetical protein VMB48_02930 [Steroidobacteraceae bacterium]|nr:hypothetical protein [Steroidobacteraceae bacterium]
MTSYRSPRRQPLAALGRTALGTALFGLLGVLAACSSGAGKVQTAGGQAADPGTVDFPIFYVKRYSVPLAGSADALGLQDLRMLRYAAPSADLFMRTNASPTGTEVNITARITGTGTSTAASYDVKDVSVSADATTILFAMRGPLTANMDQAKAPSWRIWQYVIATDTLSQVINPADDPEPTVNGEPVNDVAPQFLPDGRIVFTSTRQTQSQGVLLDEGFQQFIAEDEDRTEPAFVLHVMNADGTDIHQISFNASHDRDPTVLMSGRVMWSRWDDAPPASKGMHLYTANPDGTDLQLLYGANSHATGTNADGTNDATTEFVKAHEMQDGRILALVRPYTGTDYGGDLVIIDTDDYVENTQGATPDSGLTGPAQTEATTNDVLTVPGPSPGGRFYAGFPLWDGTGRILVSWSQCRVMSTTAPPQPAPCTAAALASPDVQEAPPLYSVWMFDPSANTLQPIMQPTDGIMITDLVAAQPRSLPGVILDQQPGVTLDQNMYDAGVGEIDIRSVYDFDGVDTTPNGIAAMADPVQTPPANRPARFIRLVKPVSIPDQKTLNLNDAAFGVTNYMREILGYAPVQPDGSVVVQVPANVPFQMQILDANGRSLSPVHDAWLQVAPGETVQCNGCHTPASQQNVAPGRTPQSHGRAGVFNSAWAGGNAGIPFPNSNASYTSTITNNTAALVPTTQGQTMAEVLSAASCKVDSPLCAQDVPSVNLIYNDLWTNPQVATPGTPIALTYDPTLTNNPNWQLPFVSSSASCPQAWAAFCRIIINYTEQIQPLWTYSRTYPATGPAAGQTAPCTSCHSSTSAAGAAQVPAGQTQLDLTATASNQQPLWPISYVDLLFPHGEVQLNSGTLQPVLVTGPVDPTTGQPTQVQAQIAPVLTAGSAIASTAFFNVFAPGGSHAGYLSPAELRLLSEWVDIGAQYFNNPFDPAAPLN